MPKGHVWLEGDNLRNSTDSRCYGPVPYGLIRGRICFKVYVLRVSENSCINTVFMPVKALKGIKTCLLRIRY